MSTSTTQRLIAAALLIVAGILTLPVAAWLFDHDASAENLIIPAQLLFMATIGALLAWHLPAAAPGQPMARRLRKGAGRGLLAAVAGLTVFWFAISGPGGA